jgi:hypothetical protein
MREDIGNIQFGPALTVATTLKVLAILVLVGGIILAIQGGIELGRDETATSEDVGTFVGAVVGSTVTSAALLGAAGFALEILVGCYTQLWELRFSESADEE